MSKKLLFLAMASILVLGGAGCPGDSGPAAEDQSGGQNINQNADGEAGEINTEDTIAPEESEEVSKVGDVIFVPYVNKSADYTVDRPERWYWRHYIQREIGETHLGVTDYFITDSIPLPRLESEYLGRIVIEVSGKSLDEVASAASDLTAADAVVAGLSVKKYEGTRDNEIVKNQKVIIYAFEKDGRTFRIVYTQSNSTAEQEAVFEHMVSSMTFAE